MSSPTSTALSPVPASPANGPDLDHNLVLLIGTLSSDPRAGTLRSGDEMIRYEITCRTDDGTDSVPVVRFDPTAPERRLAAGARVVVAGRVRRRFFAAGGATASRTEVVARRLVPVGRRRQVRQLLDSTADEVRFP